MLRMTILCLAMGTLGQVLPDGCPSAPPDDTTAAERTVIETEATAAPESAEVGDTVALSATATADVDGGAITYSWLQDSGPGTPISNANQATATFTAPSLPTDQTCRFMVTTTNERGDAGRASVEVLVLADPNYGVDDTTPEPGAGAPVARAGIDRDITESTTVTLDARNSTGDQLTYRWLQSEGESILVLQDAQTATATFTAPAFVPNGNNTYVMELRVYDRRGRSDIDTVELRVVEGDDADPTPQVSIRTSLGTFVVQLDREKAPISVENFLRYVDDGYYDGTIFHRVIAGFVVQGGGFEPDLVQKETNDPIQNEASNGLSNLRGTVAMARTSDPNSATSQFFVNLDDNTQLDPGGVSPDGYAVFGEVISGMDVIDEIAAVETGSQTDPDGRSFNDVPVDDVVLIDVRRVLTADKEPTVSGG